uniref:Retrotransposon gag domain-containing protein n=1 Tax=Cajanus cajan TaxID=3821 RepID=A0A151RQ61_CAJCA|nr:hypothetical protein KK1_033863 [Cajanus cajan]
MKRSLISKNKFKFVNGSLPATSTFDPSFDAWERCNNLVLSWILNSVDPILSQSIEYVEVATTAWKLLKDRFSQGDRVRIFELQEELMAMKQGTNSVAHYFIEMTTLWDELDNYRPLPDCVCHMKCVCVASKNGRLFKEEDCIMKFLSGLNEEFDVVRTQILMMEPFPNVNKALSLVLQHERRIGSNNNVEEQTFVGAMEGRTSFGRGKGGFKSYGFGNKGNFKLCSFCGKTGHTVDTYMPQHSQFSPEQYKALMALIQSSNPASSSGSNQVAALTTTPISNLTLNSDFSLNIISVSKLISSLHCTITFLPNACLI